MKLMYVTVRIARFLITGILMFGFIAIGYYDYAHCKKMNLEKMSAICRKETEEENEDCDVIE